jgi:recombination protein RecR
MGPIEKLTQMFGRFPGIGPRQAKRFVYFLLSESPAYTRELVDYIVRLKKEVSYCPTCFRLTLNQASQQCSLCKDISRDTSVLMVIAKDIDLENIARSGEFNGRYFILGGLLQILEKYPEQKIRIRELVSLVQKMAKEGLKEVIVALSANPEGDNTADYVKNALSPICTAGNIKISVLGRGLSTGTELEYSDSDTIRNALKNRQ